MPEGGRVIGGNARGIRLETPRRSATRPLADRVKESLFGALEAAGALDGPFLDLFAGIGSGGIEALSRGAPRATFVEHDGKTCDIIGANLRRAHLEGGRVVRADAVAFLKNGRPKSEEAYRTSLLDPPYGDPVLGRALDLVAAKDKDWLVPGATVVVKHFWRDEMPESVGVLTRDRLKRFGETSLTFYTRAEEGA
ncbi:MAG: RsmD family RNA methyltransferase [Chloroflexota bacterium]